MPSIKNASLKTEQSYISQRLKLGENKRLGSVRVYKMESLLLKPKKYYG